MFPKNNYICANDKRKQVLKDKIGKLNLAFTRENNIWSFFLKYGNVRRKPAPDFGKPLEKRSGPENQPITIQR